MGLNSQLPKNHPLISMFRKTLTFSHGSDSSAADNYIANVSRVLHFVHQRLVETHQNPMHWSDLVSTDVHVYQDFIRL